MPDRLKANWTQAVKDAFARFPEDWPDIEYVLVANGRNLVASESMRNLATIGISMTVMTSRGNMTIQSADNSVPPVISPNWLTSEEDQMMAVAAYRRAREIIAGLGDVLITQEISPGLNVTSDADLLRYIQQQGISPIHHGSSTCAMGKVGNKMTAVDSKARVVGVSKLRAIDSSSFAFTPPGHTQGTTYGHAEKLVQDIIDDYS